MTDYRNALLFVQVCTGLWALIAFFYQLKRNREIAKGRFIYDISIGAQKYSKAIDEVEKRKDKQVLNALGSEELRELRDFLRFCESIMLLLEDEVIRDDEVFPLLGYRIYLVTSNRQVQDAFLFENDKDTKKARYTFCAIFALHSRIKTYMELRFKNDLNKVRLNYMIEHDLSQRDGYKDAYNEGINAYNTHKPRLKKKETRKLRESDKAS